MTLRKVLVDVVPGHSGLDVLGFGELGARVVAVQAWTEVEGERRTYPEKLYEVPPNGVLELRWEDLTDETPWPQAPPPG